MFKMDRLKELYYNPRTGFVSPYKIYIKLNKTIPLSVIKKFIKEQEISQITKNKNKHHQYKSINVYSTNNQWQIDLVDYSKFSSGFKYLLCIVDVFSRKAFVIPIKKKSNTTEAMKNVLENQKPVVIQSDNGKEFLNGSFQSLLTDYGVRHITARVGDHKRQGIVERFNRTIEGMISKYQEAHKTNGYVDILDFITENYNNSFHSI